MDLDALQQMRRELAQREQTISDRIAPLEAERTALQRQGALLEELIAIERERTSPATDGTARTADTRLPSTATRTTDSGEVLDAAFRSLRRPLHRTEVPVVAASVARQLGLSVDIAPATLMARLTRDPRYVSVRRGFWAPAEWPDDKLIHEDGKAYLQALQKTEETLARWRLAHRRAVDLMKDADGIRDPSQREVAWSSAARAATDATSFARQLMNAWRDAQGRHRELGAEATYFPEVPDLASEASAVDRDARGEVST